MQKSLFIFLCVTSLFSNQFSVNPSFQGFTGVINTPNAQVTQEGHTVFHINNQFDNNIKAYNYNVKDSSQEDYILGLGLFSFLEVQTRLSEAPGYHRDLSFNAKVQLPYHHKYLPDFAFGVQDYGGDANHYGNTYIVLDKELSIVRASIGYGSSTNENPRIARMNGMFGSVELKATDWLYAMAEDDSTEKHLGIRVEIPSSWTAGVSLRATIAQNMTNSATSFALNVDIPLWHESKMQQDLYEESHEKILQLDDASSIKADFAPIATQPVYQNNIAPNKIRYTLTSLTKKLVDFGFENVKVGTKGKTLYVEAENSIFDHNDLDAIGYIAGLVATSGLSYEKYGITLLKNRLKTITVIGDTASFNNYINNPSFSNKKIFSDNLYITRNFNDSNIKYRSKENSSLFIPRIELSPGLINAVGTEVGVFDYALSLKTNAYMTIYDGLVISALYETPIANSNDFDPKGAFYKQYEAQLQSRFVNIMAHQTLHLDNILSTFSVGKYRTDYIGVINQTNYTTDSGEHAFMYKGGRFVKEENTDLVNYFSLASYRYAYAPLDTYLSVTYGSYWFGDVGGELELKRFFGETSVAFNYKNSHHEDFTEQFAGIKVSIPLTSRKLYKANYLQVKGKKDFVYKLRTTVNKSDGTNTINNDFGRIPDNDFEIESHYLNRDRLSSSYIRQHVDKLRDAYITYAK